MTPVRWVLVFLSYALLSFLWTGAVAPASSFAHWLALAVDIATMLLLLRSGDRCAQSLAVLSGYIHAACALAVLAWIMPAQYDLRLGDMEYFNTNQIGNLCACAFFFAQYLERSRRGHWTAAKILFFVTVLRSLSKTTLVALLLSQCVLFFRDGSMNRSRKFWTAAGVLISFALFWGLFASYFTIYTTTGNQSENLTGRTAIWAFTLDAALARPWFGNGFDALWHVMPAFGPDRFEARHAENEILQQFFAYGFVGVLLFVGLYGSLFRQFRQIRERSPRLVLMSLQLYIFIRGMAEAEPFDLLFPLWAIVLFSVLAAQGASLPASTDISPAPIAVDTPLAKSPRMQRSRLL